MNQRRGPERFGARFCEWPRARAALLSLLLLAPLPALAAPNVAPNAAQVRASAERLAAWAVEARRPEPLALAIGTLLTHGATLEPDDPWGAADLLGALGGMPKDGASLAADIRIAAVMRLGRGGSQRLRQASSPEEVGRARPSPPDALASARDGAMIVLTGPLAPRGVTIGVTRAELSLAPGAKASFDLLFQAQEAAIVEVRLKRGSEGADVDLRVTDASGVVLAADLGPSSGRPGYGLYVEWRPETCVATRVDLANAGSGDAHLVMLTQPSGRPQCDE